MARHVFKEPRKGFVAHTAASKILLNPQNIDDMLDFKHNVVWTASAYLVDSIDRWKGSEEPTHTGYNIATGRTESFFETTKKDARLAEVFANNMKYFQSRPGFGSDHSHLFSSFDWASVKSVVDIGGGTGATSIALTEKFPSLHCTVQDIDNVIDYGELQAVPGAMSRITFMKHDFFEEQPIKNADVYFMRWILHDWSDGKAKEILRNLIPALKPGSNVILQEFVLPEAGMLSFYHQKTMRNIDLAMKSLLNSKEREMDDWKQLFAEVDPAFKFVGVQMLPGSNLGVIHARWEKSI